MGTGLYVFIEGQIMEKLFIILFALLAFSCSKEKGEASIHRNTNKNFDKDSLKSAHEKSQISGTENWEEFYSKFHKDSLFQLSRIKFPLNGYQFYDSETRSVRWSKDNWRMLKYTINEIDIAEYKIEYIKSDSLVTTRIYKENSSINIIEKYKPINGKWYLIYYLDAFD